MNITTTRVSITTRQKSARSKVSTLDFGLHVHIYVVLYISDTVTVCGKKLTFSSVRYNFKTGYSQCHCASLLVTILGHISSML